MNSIRAQFFLSFGINGSLMPYMPVYLERTCGLSKVQVGYAMGLSSAAILLTPVLATLLADGKLGGKAVLRGLFVIAGLALVGLLLVEDTPRTMGIPGVVLVSACLCLHYLAFVPVFAIQDAVNFSHQQRLDASGESTTPYHRVRVWGTVGFILPTLFLFWLLRWGWNPSWIVVVAIVFCVLSLVNVWRLPSEETRGRGDTGTRGSFFLRVPVSPRPRVSFSSDIPPVPAGSEGRGSAPSRSTLPTLAAARAMAEPHVVVFCLAVFVTQMAAAAYYNVYPAYLIEQAGFDKQWLGLIANIGVIVEVGFMLAFGWLMRRWGLKRLMAIGALAMSLRMALLAWSGEPSVAVGTQLFHGLMVLTIHVAPPLFLNRRAGETFRNSIQGLYAMAVVGPARVVGGVVAGYIAQRSVPATFGYAAALCLLAAGMFFFAFHDRGDGAETA